MYLNVVQIAESFGVSERVVEDWIRNEGLPHVPDRGRLIFDRAQVATWAASRGLAARAGFLARDNKAFSAGVGLEALLRAGGVWRDIAPGEARALLEKVLDRVSGAPGPIRALLRQRMNAPGGLNWAPVGGGFALPHLSARVALGRDAGLIALVLLNGALPLDAAVAPSDGVPVRWLFFFVAPSPRAHLDILGGLSRLLSRGRLRELVAGGADDEAIFRFLGESAKTAPGATGKEVRS